MTNYNCLDLDVVKNDVAVFASIEEAKEYIINENIDFNPLVIKKKAVQTNEAISLIMKEINVQFVGIHNIKDKLEKVNKQITLDGQELSSLLVFHNHALRIKNIFSKLEDDLTIKDYTDSLKLNENVFNRINDCIDNTGEIKDSASSLLKDLNHSIDKLNKELYSKAEQFVSKNNKSLQEQSIYVRENRITFLIKNSDKNKYSGYAYGSSASGLASYVEPGIFIDMNNQMIDLLNQKTQEINRILKELSYLISTVSDDYINVFDSLVELNVIFAKATYGIKSDGIIAEFIDGHYFDFKDLCHPLLDSKTVVSNSYRIYEPYRGIVISGSNTGGKTVSLKAIGLSILMSYIGIPIIASSAKIPFYKNIYVDIDDNQSIKDSLSTFSAHISNINSILNNADKNSLILIDELISGTDPKEAQAISLAIIDKIKELQSIFIITTHFDDIKNYSYNDDNILLSSVGFNSETLKPTYKYYENSIGSSNALKIATKYFDDKQIIMKANEYLDKNITEQDKLLKKLAKENEELVIEKNNIDYLKKEYEKLINNYKDKLEHFENEKVKLKEKYIDELNDQLQEIRNKAEEKLNSISSIKDKIKLKEINELISINDTNENVEFNINDNVRIKDNEQIGVISEIHDDRVTVNINGLKIKTSISDLTLMPKVVKKDKYVEKKRNINVSKEINLVGKRVEDGIIELENYLDRANGANLHSVKIIHGIGTGALRSAIREKLKKLSYVKTFNDGDFYDGGSAVTIVEFK